MKPSFAARLMLRLWLLALLAPALAPAHPEPQQRVLRATSPWPIDAFTLTDQHGQPFTQDHLAGRWTFVLFGDARCAAPCAHALAALDGLLRRIAPAQVNKVTQVLFIALDAQPSRPDQLREVLARFNPRILAGTGAPATLERLVDDWRVGKEPSRSAGSLLLVGPDGAVRAEYLPPFDVALLTADYLKTRARRSGP